MLIGYADWLGYGHGERAAAWLTRFEVNAAELEMFRATPAPACPAYLPAPTPVAVADGSATNESAIPADARQALERARQRRELHAFTWHPEALEEPAVGFLCGVPIAVKDLMLVRGMPLSCGSAAMDPVVATRDAAIVARLRRAGAVVVGLANLHEFAYGITSDNPKFGRVVNPAAPSRIPGGSSGGSAAAIAAGIVRLAVGTDTAGSIRIPAACCGIVGFKPSYDALPRDGVVDLAFSLDHVGPMGLTVEDCAAMFAAMLELPSIPDWRRPDLAGTTVASLGGYFSEPLDAEVRAALEEAVQALGSDGARLIEHDIEGAALAPAIQFNIISPESTAFHAERLKQRGHQLGENVRVRIEIGLFIPGHWYVKAQRLRTQLVERIDRAFDAADALICPTLRAPAPRVGASRVDIDGRSYPLHTGVTNLTLPFNLSGLPAVSVPWSTSKDGVPICLQVVGPRGHDWRTLAFAQRLEAASPWSRKRGPR